MSIKTESISSSDEDIQSIIKDQKFRGQNKKADKKLKASSILIQNSSPEEKFIKVNDSKNTNETLIKKVIRRQLTWNKEEQSSKLGIDEF